MNGMQNRQEAGKNRDSKTKGKGPEMKTKLTPDNARTGMKVTYYTGSGGTQGHIGRGTIIGFRNYSTAIVRFGKKTVKHLSISSLNRA